MSKAARNTFIGLWLFCLVVFVYGCTQSQSNVTTTTSTSTTSVTGTTVPSGIIIGSIEASMKAHLRTVMAVGQTKGKSLRRFSKIGDSITETAAFLQPYSKDGIGYYTLSADYTYLQPIIDYYTAEVVATATIEGTLVYYWSFDWESLCATAGYTAGSAMETTEESGVVKTHLMWEISTIHPAVAIVMYCTNDITYGYPPPEYNGTGGWPPIAQTRADLNAIISTLEAEGVIPILSTIPPRSDVTTLDAYVPTYNALIKEVAAAHNIPLIDYWLSLQTLPSKGLMPDGIHPNAYDVGGGTAGDLNTTALQYGMNMRNLTALQMLAKVKRIVIDDGAPD
jgi:hypothetical protein